MSTRLPARPTSRAGPDPVERSTSTTHRAHSVVGPDGQVGDELEAGHTVSLRRGSVTAAIWALDRSARLTTDSATRGRLLLPAAEHAFGLGRADLVDRLVTAAERTGLSEPGRARREWLREPQPFAAWKCAGVLPKNRDGTKARSTAART